ncbi:MAG: hypothetical protein K5669_11490 [Lachnospiraceae bacterium]|nr:hypothetical protein [Lachnospiraceae bacterium]
MFDKYKTFKSLTAILLCSAMLTVTGCSSIPDLSEETERKVGEYAGLVMLRYDANHRSRLVEFTEPEPPLPEIEIPEETVTEETVTETPVSNDLTQETEVNDVTAEEEEEELLPEEFMELPEGMHLIYQGYSEGSSYPENSEDFFSLDATAGKKLLVLNFILYNQSGADQNVDFLGDGYAFKCTVNGTESRTALVTMLMDDMSTYRGTIANGFSEELVLIFEIDDSIDISGIELNIKSANGQCNMELQ